MLDMYKRHNTFFNAPSVKKINTFKALKLIPSSILALLCFPIVNTTIENVYGVWVLLVLGPP
jgi:hypothetical protein